MGDNVPSDVARSAQGESVKAARLRGNEEYYPRCIEHIRSSETLHYLVLLTTSSGYVTRNIDNGAPNLPDREEFESDLYAMGISDEQVLLFAAESDGTKESNCTSIGYNSIESIHGSDPGDRFIVELFTDDTQYILKTGKKKRLEDFQEAMAYLAEQTDKRS